MMKRSRFNDEQISEILKELYRKRGVSDATFYKWRSHRGTNQRWSLDFVSDSLSRGHRFRILNVIDDVSRECQYTCMNTSI
ncbi:MAG: hypothetical protein ABJ327_21590 [Litoreibacter sp.]